MRVRGQNYHTYASHWAPTLTRSPSLTEQRRHVREKAEQTHAIPLVRLRPSLDKGGDGVALGDLGRLAALTIPLPPLGLPLERGAVERRAGRDETRVYYII